MARSAQGLLVGSIAPTLATLTNSGPDAPWLHIPTSRPSALTTGVPSAVDAAHVSSVRWPVASTLTLADVGRGAEHGDHIAGARRLADSVRRGRRRRVGRQHREPELRIDHQHGRVVWLAIGTGQRDRRATLDGPGGRDDEGVADAHCHRRRFDRARSPGCPTVSGGSARRWWCPSSVEAARPTTRCAASSTARGRRARSPPTCRAAPW